MLPANRSVDSDTLRLQKSRRIPLIWHPSRRVTVVARVFYMAVSAAIFLTISAATRSQR